MPHDQQLTPQPRLVFLGSSGAIQIPTFFCSCQTCEAARQNPAQRRTRASAALLGREITLIDASPYDGMTVTLSENETLRQPLS